MPKMGNGTTDDRLEVAQLLCSLQCDPSLLLLCLVRYKAFITSKHQMVSLSPHINSFKSDTVFNSKA